MWLGAELLLHVVPQSDPNGALSMLHISPTPPWALTRKSNGTNLTEEEEEGSNKKKPKRTTW